ncbi:hypothetical protein [Clostridium sp. LP20]|uniref:hypothetical protein n=1 Tax=Clostridium sp. LP20 TaxID=3418665 RepID=UPI003EE56DD8
MQESEQRAYDSLRAELEGANKEIKNLKEKINASELENTRLKCIIKIFAEVI